MKFKFPLAALLKQRKIIEDLAQRSYQEAMAELNRQKDILQDLIQAKQNTFYANYEIQHGAGQVASSLVYNNEFMNGQDIRIERQKSKVQECEKLVEKQREILRQAAVEYKIIEKLKEKQFEEFKLDYEMKQQKEMDEQSILRYKVKESL